MAEKRRGLGRGIGALIPTGQEEKKARPIDVFFSAGASTAAAEEGSSDVAAPDITEDKLGVGTEEHAVAVDASSDEVTEAKPENEATAAKRRSEATKTRPESEAPEATAESEAPAATPEAGEELAPSSDSGDLEVPASEDASTESPSPSASSSDDAEDDLDLVPVPGTTYGEIDVTAIVPNQKQPRQIFDEDELQELADSIREVGVLQPIVVRPLNEPLSEHPDARYELIMGERRWRATQLAGKSTIPAIVRRTDDSELLRDALLENLHRAQLNPLEEAAAYQQLLEDFGCTQEELSRRIARSRPQISNTLRLLKLPPLVQRRVAAGILSAGHARALLGLTDPAAMERLAQRIVAEGLSVRATEEIVALGDDQAQASRRGRGRVSQYEDELNEVAGRLADRFDTKVKVNMGQRKGKISIDFGSIDDLNRILAALNESSIEIPGRED